MNRIYGRARPDSPPDDPPSQGEAAIRAMLEQSRREIAAGQTVPMAPVLARMREMAAFRTDNSARR